MKFYINIVRMKTSQVWSTKQSSNRIWFNSTYLQSSISNYSLSKKYIVLLFDLHRNCFSMGKNIVFLSAGESAQTWFGSMITLHRYSDHGLLIFSFMFDSSKQYPEMAFSLVATMNCLVRNEPRHCPGKDMNTLCLWLCLHQWYENQVII